MKRQRGSLLIYGIIALGVMTLAGGAVLSYNHAIKRAEKAEAAHEATRAAYAGFVAETKRLGEVAQKKSDAEIKRQKGVSDATLKSLEARLAATRAQFGKLRGSGTETSPGVGGVPAVPETARPADDTARDNRLRAVLQHAQEQTDALIELQNWVRDQGAKP